MERTEQDPQLYRFPPFVNNLDRPVVPDLSRGNRRNGATALRLESIDVLDTERHFFLRVHDRNLERLGPALQQGQRQAVGASHRWNERVEHAFHRIHDLDDVAEVVAGIEGLQADQRLLPTQASR